MKTTATTSMAKVPLLYLKRVKSSEGYLIRMISINHHYLYPLYNTHSFTGLFNTSQVYPPKVYHGTWKWHPGLGDSFWKPSFLGYMLNLGSIFPKTHVFIQGSIFLVTLPTHPLHWSFWEANEQPWWSTHPEVRGFFRITSRTKNTGKWSPFFGRSLM